MGAARQRTEGKAGKLDRIEVAQLGIAEVQILPSRPRELAQLVRASVRYTGGHLFKSDIPYHMRT